MCKKVRESDRKSCCYVHVYICMRCGSISMSMCKHQKHADGMEKSGSWWRFGPMLNQWQLVQQWNTTIKDCTDTQIYKAHGLLNGQRNFIFGMPLPNVCFFRSLFGRIFNQNSIMYRYAWKYFRLYPQFVLLLLFGFFFASSYSWPRQSKRF